MRSRTRVADGLRPVVLPKSSMTVAPYVRGALADAPTLSIIL
jgi:hypothetical protein